MTDHKTQARRLNTEGLVLATRVLAVAKELKEFPVEFPADSRLRRLLELAEDGAIGLAQLCIEYHKECSGIIPVEVVREANS